MASRTNPLPLEQTLRDLALLRAYEIDFSSLLPDPKADESESGSTDVDASVERSYEFVRQARAVLKIMNREDAEKQGSRIEDVRSILEDALNGLGA